MFGMRRRDFIALLGGAAVAWPLTARAQQPTAAGDRILICFPVGGRLDARSVTAFRQGLKENRLMSRAATLRSNTAGRDGQGDRLPLLAAEFGPASGRRDCRNRR